MRLLFIRHGDPDYSNDTLTEKGKREAEYLADYADRLDLGTCYVSPLGRAQATAAYCLERLGKNAKTLDWLREFPAQVYLDRAPQLAAAYPEMKKENGMYKVRHVVWDMAPAYLSEHDECLDSRKWKESEICRYSDTVELYDHVSEEFDRLLAQYGYVRNGRCYRVEKENTQTLTFFCHFGLTCVLLSRLWSVSPFALWQSLALAPTSVTEVVTEERQQGTAHFRALRLGDISHLNIAGEPASFSARFCEVYSNMEQRH